MASELETLITGILNDKTQFEKLITGLPLEFKEMKNQRVGVVVALHCCLNGPVGVNKMTTFPLIGAGSIKNLVGVAVSNKSWKGFCKVVASFLDNAYPNIKCTSMTVLGSYWPLREWLPAKTVSPLVK